MTEAQTPSSPSLEQIPGSSDVSFRLISWEESVASPQIHHGHLTHSKAGGMGDRWHYHPELELTHFSAGEGIRLVGDSIRQVRAPETVLLGAHLPHQWQVGQSRGIALQFRTGTGSAFAAIPELSGLDDLWKRAAQGLLFRTELSQRISEDLREAVEQPPIPRFAVILNLLDTIGKATLADPESVTALSRPIKWDAGAGSYSERISEAIDFIGHHFQDPITLQDVLEHTSLSRATFSRHFPQFTGQSFTVFLQQFRLEYCRRMLAESKCSVTEAAYGAGFQNLSHFNRLFRKRWGQTPSQFRKTIQESQDRMGSADSS